MWGTSSKYPSIRNYGDAKRAYENTKPLRGKPHFRPLDCRSSRAKSQIIKDGDDYIIRLYQTDIVRYKPDGRVVVSHGGWVSQATAGAISAMSPFTAWCSKGYLVVTAASNRWYSGACHKFVVPSGGLEFDEHCAPKNPPTAVIRKKRVRRDVAKKVRAHFKQVPKMIEAYAKAFEGGVVGERRIPSVPRDALDTPLGEEAASEIAMRYLGCRYDLRENKRVYTGRGEVSLFWRDVYRVFDCVETYEVLLPYGEVP